MTAGRALRPDAMMSLRLPAGATGQVEDLRRKIAATAAPGGGRI
jgi:hypothetical protein